MVSIIYFIGLPISIPLAILIAASYVAIKNCYISLVRLEPFSPVVSTNDLKIIASITAITILFIFIVNVFRFTLGVRDFNPFSSNLSAPSLDKLKAQNKKIPHRYLSNKPDGLTVGKRGYKYVRIPFESSPEHQVIYGSPGSGKSTILKNGLLHIFNRRKDVHGGLIFDVKPELSRGTVDEHRKDIKVLNPSIIDKNRYGFNVYHGLKKSSSDDELIERFTLISRTIIENPGGDNAFFYISAQNILTAFLIYAFRMGLSFGDAIRYVLDANTSDLISEILASDDMDKHPKVKRIIKEYEGKESDAFQDVTMTLRQELAIFDLDSVNYFFSKDNPKLTSPKDIRNGCFLFLAIPDNLLMTYRAIFRLVSEMCINYLMGIPENPSKRNNYWLLIDEAGSIGKINSMIDALSRGRSKGIQISLVAQSFSQLVETYGRQGATTITNCCKVQIILSCYDPETSRTLSQRCGNYRETKISTHSSYGNIINSPTGSNESEEYRPIMDISDIECLERDDKVLVFSRGDWFVTKKAPFFKIKQNKVLSDKLLKINKNFYSKKRLT